MPEIAWTEDGCYYRSRPLGTAYFEVQWAELLDAYLAAQLERAEETATAAEIAGVSG